MPVRHRRSPLTRTSGPGTSRWRFDDTLGPLTTERLVLRGQEPGDAELFHRLWSERDPRVPPHRRLVDGRPSVDDIAEDIEAAGPDPGGPRLLSVVLRSSGAVIGYCGLNVREGGPVDEAELAYELERAAHGHGYATEAGAAVVAAAAAAGFVRLWAGVWSWNRASRRVLDKLGFRELGRVEPSSEHGHSLMTTLDLPRPGRRDRPEARRGG